MTLYPHLAVKILLFENTFMPFVNASETDMEIIDMDIGCLYDPTSVNHAQISNNKRYFAIVHLGGGGEHVYFTLKISLLVLHLRMKIIKMLIYLLMS